MFSDFRAIRLLKRSKYSLAECSEMSEKFYARIVSKNFSAPVSVIS